MVTTVGPKYGSLILVDQNQKKLEKKSLCARRPFFFFFNKYSPQLIYKADSIVLKHPFFHDQKWAEQQLVITNLRRIQEEN